jgi:hypothetical protein
VACARISRRNRVIIICDWCGKEKEKPASHKNKGKHGYNFCSRRCKDNAQRLGGIEDIHPPHYGHTKEKYPHRAQFSEEEMICNRCGYNEFISCVDIHHIDFNPDNNDKDNLIPLCSNCHRALHWGKWEMKDLGQ